MGPLRSVPSFPMDVMTLALAQYWQPRPAVYVPGNLISTRDDSFPRIQLYVGDGMLQKFR